MVRKIQPKDKIEHFSLGIKIKHFEASVDAAINYEVRSKPHNVPEDAPIYRFNSGIEIEGACNYPDKQAGDAFSITFMAAESKESELAATLGDYRLMDEGWRPVSKRVKGQDIPVYAIPKGLGHLDRHRGKRWTGYVPITPRTLSNMLALLSMPRELYISIHGQKIERHHHILGITLQTNDPATS
jgi:hypothetical protein